MTSFRDKGEKLLNKKAIKTERNNIEVLFSAKGRTKVQNSRC